MPRIEGSPEDQPPMSQDEGKGDQPNGQVEQPDPNDPAVAQKALLSLGQSLNQLKAGLQQAGIPPEALSKLEDASQAYMDFLDMVSGNAKPQASGPVPEAAQGGKNIVPADNMANGRKGVKPQMA